MAGRRSFTFVDFALRWFFAAVLVLVTFNPTDWNFITWLRDTPGQLPWKLLAGLVLTVGWVIYLRATWRAMGIFGVLLVLAVLAALGWVLVDQGIVDLRDHELTTWLLLVAGATLLGVGMSWSHIRRILSGQLDVDDVDG